MVITTAETKETKVPLIIIPLETKVMVIGQEPQDRWPTQGWREMYTSKLSECSL